MDFSQLLTLSKDNDAEGVRALLKMGCDPSFGNRMGQTALHIGALWGSVDAVRTLLEGRADPNRQNKMRGSTPLHTAVTGRGPVEGRTECVKLIIKHKGNPNLPDLQGCLPIEDAGEEELRLALGAKPLVLHKAVESRKLETLHSAIDAVLKEEEEGGGLTLDTPNPEGDSALHLAISRSWQQGVVELLAVNADPRLPNYARRSPLHTAVLRGQHQIVALLIGTKVDVNLQDRDMDHDPRFSSSTFKEKPECHRTPLHYAAELGNVIAARFLIKAKADVNRRDGKDLTPLHLCLELRKPEVTIERGMGVRISGLQKKPELNGRLGAVIGQARPSADRTSPERFPVLIEGDGAGDGTLLKADNINLLKEEILDLLLEARADVNLGNQIVGEQRTVLHEAARSGDAALTEKVLSTGAAIGQQDKMGFSALHIAARGKHIEVVRLLVKAKADKTQVNAQGNTALQLAQKNGAGGEVLTLLAQDDSKDVEVQPAAGKPTTLSSLTAEQRAMLFID
mmetsp:Transcript_110789/g.213392  ORF Transcript_110789/g.213392 Transcript_110789/m.213392 type:complete len:511 (-) Transcript_110789:395-1927(-)